MRHQVCVWTPSVVGSVAVCGWPEACEHRLRVCGEDTELSWYILMVSYGRFGGNMRARPMRPWCRGMWRVGGFLLRVASRMHVATQNAPHTPTTLSYIVYAPIVHSPCSVAYESNQNTPLTPPNITWVKSRDHSLGLWPK